MPDTFSFEEAQGTAAATTTPPAELSRVQLTPYERDELAAGPTGNRQSYSMAVPPAFNPDYDFTRATHGDPILAVPLAIGAKIAGTLEQQMPTPARHLLTGKDLSQYADTAQAEQFPFQPVVQLPKVSDQDKKLLPGWARKAATVVNQINGSVEQFLTPEQIVQLPALELKPVQAMYLTQIAAATPELIQNIENAQTPDERLAAQTQLGIHLGMAALLAKGATKSDLAKLPDKIPVEWRQIQSPAPSEPTPLAAPSEFGGAAETPAAVQTPGPAAQQPAPVPEASKTIQAQMDWLKQGKRSAVLITPGEAMPDVPDQFNTVKTTAGTFIYDPKQTTRLAIHQAVARNTIGEVLGYGIADKPAPADAAGVVTVRAQDGTEKQAVVTDQASAPEVIRAAQQVADKTDTVQVETPDQVLTQRQPLSTIERKYLSEDLAQRKPLSRDIVQRATAEGGFALPEGYELQGNQYTFTEAAPKETPAQRQAREQREAMAGLRAQPKEPIAQNANELSQLWAGRGVKLNLAETGDKIHLDLISVPEERQNQGIGTKVLDDLKELSNRTGKPIELITMDSVNAEGVNLGDKLRSFYERNGFKPYDRGTGASGRKLTDGYRYEPVRTQRPQDTRSASEIIRDNLGEGTPLPTFERPPDILDDIEGQFGGIQIPDTADFADYRAAVKDLSQSKAAGLSGSKLKGLFQGEKADTALDELHDQGLYLRIQTPEELFDEMIRAAKSRLDWMEQEKAAAKFEPSPEDVARTAEQVQKGGADRALEFLDSLKIDTRGMLYASFGLTPDAWNALIDLAKLGVKAGKAVADAVDWAIQQFKAKFPNQQFDEAGARDHLNGRLRESNLTRRLLDDPTVPAAVKAAVDPLYEQKPLPTTAEQANTILQQRGLEGAIQEHHNNPSLPEDVRVALGAFIDEHMRTQAGLARAAGKPKLAELWEQRQVDFFNGSFRPEGTELGRAVNAFKLFGANSAHTWLKQYNEALMSAAGHRFDRVKPAVDEIIQTLRQANAQALDTLRADPATNGAARAAVDDAIANSSETHRAVIMDLAGPWSQSPEIVRMAREQVRAKADELLNRAPRPPGLTPAQHLRAIMDDLAKRAADIAAGHYQGAEPGMILRDKLMQRLGLGEEAAGRLAKQLDAEFERQVKAAKEKLPKRIATQRARQTAAPAPDLTTDTALDRAIRRQLREHNINLGNLLKQAAATVDGTRKGIADRIVDASGLTGEKAEALRATLQKRWEAIVTQKKQAMLATLQNPRTRAVVTRPGLSERVIQLSNLGAFDDQKVYDAVREKLKLPTYDPAVAREITRRANELQQMPRGSLQQSRATEQLMAYISAQKGMSFWEMAQSYWYANLLSGLSTQAKVAIYNAFSIGAHTFTQMVQHPTAIPQMIEAIGRAIPKGADTAGAVLRDGTVPGIGVKMFEHGHGVERWTGTAAKLALPWKVMLRALGAQHLVMFKPAAEIKALVLARELAKTENAQNIAARAREILGWTPQQQAAAAAQATAEGLQGLDFRRRTQQILEQQRPATVQQPATEWAKRVTAVSEPYGILGAVTRGFDTAAKSAPILNLIVPFRRIVANVANDALGWTPLGWAERMLEYRQKGTMFGNPVNADQLADTHAQAIVGTIGMAALAYAAANGTVSITAQGPATPEQRKTLHSTTGWVPHSIKIGSRYYSYMDRPAEVPLAIIGHYMDAMKYQKLDQEDALNRVAYAVRSSKSVVLESGWLQSLAAVFDQADAYSTKNASERFGTQIAKTASGFVPMSQLLKQIDRLFDPQVYDADGIQAKVLMQLPFARKTGEPVLNRFGQPIASSPLDAFVSNEKPDPIIQLLIAKKALPADVSQGELNNAEYYLLVKRAGPMFYKALVDNAAAIAGKSDRDAKALVEKLSTETTAKAKQALGFDSVEKLRKR